MKITKIVASALIILTASAASFAQNVDEIIAKHIEAMGGADKWKTIKSMQMNTRYGY